MTSVAVFVEIPWQHRWQGRSRFRGTPAHLTLVTMRVWLNGTVRYGPAWTLNTPGYRHLFALRYPTGVPTARARAVTFGR